MNTKIFKPVIAIIAVLLTVVGATAQETKKMYVMKDDAVIRGFDISRIDSIIFYNPNNPDPVDPAVDKGVIINGVKWATRNVAEPGYFATDPEDAGMFYRWNSKIAWSSTGKVTGWDVHFITDEIWEKANDPSPAGWHVPTYNDIQKLCDATKVNSEWTTENSIPGRRFTDKETGKSIFLPAAGSRIYGDLQGNNKLGDYWGNTMVGKWNEFIVTAVSLSFSYKYFLPTYASSGSGCSIRPVAD
jgi:uncharacterized protein (TIGR02145 family)